MNDDNIPVEYVAPPRRMGLLAILRARRLLAFAVFLLVFVPGVYLTWSRGLPGYVATAQIYVAPQFPKVLEGDPEVEQQARNYNAFLAQQANDLVRPEVLEQALDEMGQWAEIWTYGGSRSLAVSRLAKRLEIDAKQGSFTIVVSLEGGDPYGLAETVNAVVDTYLDSQQALLGSDVRLVALERLATEQEAVKEGLLEQKSLLAKELGVASFTLSADNPYQLSLNETGLALQTARRDLLAAQAALAALEAEQTARLGLEVESEARLAVLTEMAGTSTRDPLSMRREELQTVMARHGADHPGGAALRAELATLEERFAAQMEERVEERTDLLLQRRNTEAAVEMLQASEEVQRLQSYVSSIEQEFDRLKERVGWFVQRFAQGAEIEQKISLIHAFLNGIQDRMTFLKTESSGPGFARLHSPARTPEIPTRGGHMKYVLAMFVLASGAAVGLTVLVDNLDQRIYTPYDIERGFGYPPIGWTLDRTSGKQARFADDQLRRLALSLDREHRRTGTKVFVITAVRPGAGTTTFVNEIGEELTEIGARVLTVQASVDGEPSLNGRKGLIEVLRGELPLSGAIQPGTPARLPLGSREGQRHLPAVHRIADLLHEAAEGYDFVLVDAPPVLLSSDTELLVSSSDATLLLVSARSDALGEVRRAVKILERLSPPSVGFVLTRVQGPGDWEQYREMIRAHEPAGREPAGGLV